MWQPIETIPRDERTVELLSASGQIDRGNWYAFHESSAPSGDIQDHINSLNGYGEYTHWREAQ